MELQETDEGWAKSESVVDAQEAAARTGLAGSGIELVVELERLNHPALVRSGEVAVIDLAKLAGNATRVPVPGGATRS